MKIRLTGNQKDFDAILKTLMKNKLHFDSFRKPQLGGNPRYKPGGDKYNEKEGEQLLMYLECDADTFAKMLKKLPDTLK